MNVLIGISKCNVVPLLDRIPLLPWWLRRKASAYNVGDLGSIPGSGRSPGKGKGNPLQYSCLENSMDRGAWWVTKSQTGLSDFTSRTSCLIYQMAV